VLILPPGHAEQVRAPLRGGARERWMLWVGGVLTLALVVVAVIAITTSGRSSGKGCVSVTIPYSLGGQEIYKCGQAARNFCVTSGRPGGFTGAAGQAVAVQCRKAGLHFG
jgi:hypothetical protein